MPFKSASIPLPPSLDRRRKLSDDNKEEIRELYKAGGTSQRALAKQFNVSRRLIQFVLDPEKLTENYQRRVARGGSSVYYDRENHTRSIREHRRYKQDLYVQGIIANKGEAQ